AKLSATEYKELLAKYVTEEKFKDLSVPDKDVSISLFYEFDEELDDDGMVHLLDAVVNKHPNYNININEVHKTLSDPNVSDDDKKVLTYATLAKATLNLETLPDYYKLALVNVIQERGKIAVDEKPFAAVNSATKLLPLLIVLPIVLLGVAFFALKKNRSGKSHAQK
ncbi:MAG: hypothetical protein LBT59_11485, partial [Clostridiales bacterium]|nr:hypothetical protein [Clostridiales bacterium]